VPEELSDKAVAELVVEVEGVEVEDGVV